MKYHHIKININTKNKPSYYTGSMLRGAFGHALKRVTCINPSYQCKDCFSAQDCLYYDFYEKENVQHRYRFDIELNSKSYDFGLYLFDDACSKLPYILSSLEIALTKNGLGKERTTFNNIQIKVNDIIVYQEGGFAGRIDVKTQKIETKKYTPDLKIKLITPLRIKKSNHLEYDKIRVEHILRSIYQRAKYIFDNEEVHSLDYKPTYTTSVKVFDYKPLYRKSDRQKEQLVMAGVLGEMAVLGLDKRSYELLQIGEVLGVGKQTTFGMGKIKIEEV